MTRAGFPTWLAGLLLVGSAVGLVAACVLAWVAVTMGNGRLPTLVLAAAPLFVLAVIAGAIAALRRGRPVVAAALCTPPILLGIGLVRNLL